MKASLHLSRLSGPHWARFHRNNIDCDVPWQMNNLRGNDVYFRRYFNLFNLIKPAFNVGFIYIKIHCRVSHNRSLLKILRCNLRKGIAVVQGNQAWWLLATILDVDGYQLLRGFKRVNFLWAMPKFVISKWIYKMDMYYIWNEFTNFLWTKFANLVNVYWASLKSGYSVSRVKWNKLKLSASPNIVSE